MLKTKLWKIRIDLLNTFKYLVKFQNFSETARVLNKTQGTISMHLKELEEIFGGNRSKIVLNSDVFSIIAACPHSSINESDEFGNKF